MVLYYFNIKININIKKYINNTNFRIIKLKQLYIYIYNIYFNFIYEKKKKEKHHRKKIFFFYIFFLLTLLKFSLVLFFFFYIYTKSFPFFLLFIYTNKHVVHIFLRKKEREREHY